ncbi:hypothetical protein Tco_0680611 [Tanacetum coccineum]|uniref:Uncharacterized protein n=1 Tax=Tanacetum coccineum TaxID=301880 RepID=A0ABQ4XL32_9ASTR
MAMTAILRGNVAHRGPTALIEKALPRLHEVPTSVLQSRHIQTRKLLKWPTELMDKKISTFAERQAENKRKFDNNNQAQQQLPKRQNVGLKLTPLGLVKEKSMLELYKAVQQVQVSPQWPVHCKMRKTGKSVTVMLTRTVWSSMLLQSKNPHIL